MVSSEEIPRSGGSDDWEVLIGMPAAAPTSIEGHRGLAASDEGQFQAGQLGQAIQTIRFGNGVRGGSDFDGEHGKLIHGNL
jgi:hypothetical protein